MAVTINADNGAVSGSAGLKYSSDGTGVLALQTNGTTAVSVSTAQVVTLTNALAEASGGTGTTTGYYGFKNRIINGAMVIDQRNAGASVTPANNQYTLDRWAFSLAQTSKITVEQTITGVSAPVGFTDYLAVTSSSAYSVLTGDFFALFSKLEGFNTADLAWGTANASTVTLSFWVRSSLTGTFGGSIVNDAGNRSYPFSYSIPTANTWTQISITIAGDTTGTWIGATNGNGLNLRFGLGAGSTFSGTAGAWAAGNFVQPASTVSVVGTNTATWYITGVQLEKGSTATSFDYRPYGTELQLCQRYFFKSDVLGVGGANASNSFVTHIAFGVPMRSTPSIVAVAGTSWIISDDFNADFTAASPAVGSTYSQSSTSWRGQLTGFSGLTVGRFYGWVPAVANAISFSSEL